MMYPRKRVFPENGVYPLIPELNRTKPGSVFGGPASSRRAVEGILRGTCALALQRGDMAKVIARGIEHDTFEQF